MADRIGLWLSAAAEDLEPAAVDGLRAVSPVSLAEFGEEACGTTWRTSTGSRRPPGRTMP